MDGYNQSSYTNVLTALGDDFLLQLFEEDCEDRKMKRFKKSSKRGDAKAKGQGVENLTSCDSSESSEESSQYRNRSERSSSDAGTTPTSLAPATNARSSPLPIPFSNPIANEIAANNEERMKYDRL